MIACICKGVSGEALEKMINDGLTLDCMRKEGIGTFCGICIPHIEEKIKELKNLKG